MFSTHRAHDGRTSDVINHKSPLGCATLLPVKYFQISGERKIFLKSGQNFTGKSVAQVSVPSYYF
jgi:hypothetical protein